MSKSPLNCKSSVEFVKLEQEVLYASGDLSGVRERLSGETN